VAENLLNPKRVTRIRLTKKLALTMNGIDVSKLRIGDIMELPEDRAQMMIDHGWAERVPDPIVARLIGGSRRPRTDLVN
jgi:hypothetical protein